MLPDRPDLKERFLASLKAEWAARAPLLKGREVLSIYFGGGTPSLLTPEQIKMILSWVRNSDLTVSADVEITLEANPESVTLQQIEGFASAGINRVSLGVQSLVDESLEVLGRGHNSSVAINAISTIQRAGIKNLTIDLMYELPKQTIDSWKKTLDQLEKLNIQHLSLYNLTFEPHTAYYKNRKTLQKTLPTEPQGRKMLEMAIADLEKIGLKRYEISAFAKPGFESRHNSGYWTGRPFLGFGPSAFSYWDGARFSNVANLQKYEEKAATNATDFYEKLAEPHSTIEKLAVELRLLRGANLTNYPPLPPKTLAKITTLIASGSLTKTGSTLSLTSEGTFFYDAIAVDLLSTILKPE